MTGGEGCGGVTALGARGRLTARTALLPASFARPQPPTGELQQSASKAAHCPHRRETAAPTNTLCRGLSLVQGPGTRDQRPMSGGVTAAAGGRLLGTGVVVELCWAGHRVKQLGSARRPAPRTRALPHSTPPCIFVSPGPATTKCKVKSS